MLRPSDNIRPYLGGVDAIAVIAAFIIGGLPSGRLALAFGTACLAGLALGVWRAVRILHQLLLHATVQTDVVLEDAQ